MFNFLSADFNKDKTIYPKHLYWTWIFFPIFLIDLLIQENLICRNKIKLKNKLWSNKYLQNIKDIKEYGFTILPEYLNTKETDELKTQLSKFKIKSNINYLNHIEKKVEGSVRYRYINPPNIFIKELMKINIMKNIYSHLILKRPKISFMESFTEYLPKNSQLIFANNAHIDSYRHQLKYVIAIEDVSIENGPTEYLPKSHKFRIELLLNYFLTWIYEKKIVKGMKQHLSSKIIKSYTNSKRELLTLNKGDLLIFNSRGLHRASDIRSGSRNLLWFYFD